METLSACDTADNVRTRQLSARDVVEAALTRIEQHNPALNAFVTLDAEGARANAARIDEAIARCEDPGPLAGVPIGVKDLEPVAGLRYTSGSRAYADRIATEDSVQVQRLKRAGAIVLGKTNTPEFGYKGFTENQLFGPSRNPWDVSKTPGGSSGGSASAVAGGLVALCTGSDGGGSIRIPAALCGCYGIKPTSGRIPRAFENAPTWGTHSTLGPLARTVRDAARYLDVAVGPHPNDLDSLDGPTGCFEAAVFEPRPRLRRIGWSATFGYAPIEPEVAAIARAAAARLAASVGAELVDADPGFPDPMVAWYSIAAPGDCVLVDSMTDEQRAVLEPGFAAFTERARALTGANVAAGLETRHQLNRTLTAYFERFDLLLSPTTSVTAFVAEGPPPSTIGGQPAGPAGFIPFTPPFNLTGHPAASLPAGLAKNGLPVGLQVIAPRFADTLVLAVSAAYEADSPWQYPAWKE